MVVVLLPFTPVQLLIESSMTAVCVFAVQVPLPSEVKSGDFIILTSSPSARLAVSAK